MALGSVPGMTDTVDAPAAPDLSAAADVVGLVDDVIGTAVRRLAERGGPDADQVVAYDLAHAASAAATARSLLDYGAKGDVEARLTCAFVADTVHDVMSRLAGREQRWGVDTDPLRDAHGFLERYRDPDFVAALADQPGPRHLDADMELVQDTFRSFAANVVAPHAEHVHRHNADVPEDIVAGLAEIGAFGLSVPAEYGGLQRGRQRRVPGDGRRHRGAEPGQPGHRRVADHPPRDPDQGAREGRHRGAEERTGSPSWPRPR